MSSAHTVQFSLFIVNVGVMLKTLWLSNSHFTTRCWTRAKCVIRDALHLTQAMFCITANAIRRFPPAGTQPRITTISAFSLSKTKLHRILPNLCEYLYWPCLYLGNSTHTVTFWLNTLFTVFTLNILYSVYNVVFLYYFIYLYFALCFCRNVQL